MGMIVRSPSAFRAAWEVTPFERSRRRFRSTCKGRRGYRPRLTLYGSAKACSSDRRRRQLLWACAMLATWRQHSNSAPIQAQPWYPDTATEICGLLETRTGDGGSIAATLAGSPGEKSQRSWLQREQRQNEPSGLMALLLRFRRSLIAPTAVAGDQGQCQERGAEIALEAQALALSLSLERWTLAGLRRAWLKRPVKLWWTPWRTDTAA